MLHAIRFATVFAAVFLVWSGPAAASEPDPERGVAESTPDGSMALTGGQDASELPTLTVKGENRIHIDFDRPDLTLQLDPREAPGLEWGDPLAMLQRESVNLQQPYLAASAKEPLVHLADPWATGFRRGAVARFQPALEGVSEWKLVIADSRSEPVAEFFGTGKPPKEIEWDGRCLDGTLASPAFTYSYSLEASDKAGNRRNFVGPGFRLPAYRGDQADGHVFLMTGSHFPDEWQKSAPLLVPTLLLEVASDVNRRAHEGTIEVRVAAPTFSHADAIAGELADCLRGRVAGNPDRIRTVAKARPGAPAMGEIAIVIRAVPPE